MIFISWILEKLRLEEPLSKEEMKEKYNWKNFRVNERIWCDANFLRPGISYYRQLQVCYEQVVEEMADSYLYDVGSLRDEFNRLHLRNCQLERELTITKGENEILQRQLDSALTWQTAQGRRNEIYSSHNLPIDEPINKAPKTGTKFTSKNGATKQENMMLTAAYYENSWTIEEIASELQLSPNSIKSYLSTIRKHYQVTYSENRRVIKFDQEFGSCEWDLCLYEKLSIKFPEDNTYVDTQVYLT